LIFNKLHEFAQNARFFSHFVHFVVYKSPFSVYNNPVRKPPQNMITLAPKWEKHSTYLGYQIFKREANTGTSGGMWKTDSTTFKSLARAKAWLEYRASLNA
jgi:hypothetical protein